MTLLWLIACGPRWAEPGVVAPTLARMDADGNGRVDQAEYEAVRLDGAPFQQVDGDADGALSAGELLALVRKTDPTEAGRPGGPRPARTGRDGASATPRGRPPEKPEDQPGDVAANRSEAQLVVKMILESLREEVRAASPNHAVPTDDEIKLAAGTADIRTAESRALLLRLEAASDEVGVAFPAALREAALRERPVTPSFVAGSLNEIPGPGGGPARPEGAGPAKGPTGPRRPDGTP